MKYVFTKMSLAHLIRFITGGEKKLELDVNVHVQTRFSRHDDNPAGTVWSKKDAWSTKLLVQEAFEEFWTSTTSAGNQHLFLKLIIGGRFAGPAGTTISLVYVYKSYQHYNYTARDVKELDDYATKLCENNDNEVAYL